MNRIKVLVVDDHALTRRGIIDTLAGQEELEVVGEAADGVEAVNKARELAPDVVLMDLMMPRLGGLEATGVIKTELPQINILILTVSDKETDLFVAIKAGAKGYLLKNAEPDELIRAVFHIAQGGVIVSPPMAEKLLDEFKTVTAYKQEADALSQREGEVLELVAQMMSNKEIAVRLSISENTVKTHVRNILEKLHLANRAVAAAFAAKIGFASPDKR